MIINLPNFMVFVYFMNNDLLKNSNLQKVSATTVKI